MVAVSHPVWTADTPQYREAYEDFKKKLTLAVPTVGQYISYYSNSSSELSLQVQSPFYISDLRSISRTTIVLDLDSSDSRMPEIIRKIRRLDGGEISAALTIYGLGGEKQNLPVWFYLVVKSFLFLRGSSSLF